MKKYIVNQWQVDSLVFAAKRYGEAMAKRYAPNSEDYFQKVLEEAEDYLHLVLHHLQGFELPEWAVGVCDQHDTKYLSIKIPEPILEDD